MLGLRPDLPVLVRLDDMENSHPRNPANLVEGAAARRLDQPLVSHVVQQLLESDLVVAAKIEGARDLALSGRLIGRRNEIEDLLSARQPFGAVAGHQKITKFAFA